MLKRCPFCGSKPAHKTQPGFKLNPRMIRVSVECLDCGASTKEFGNVSDAEDMWNIRIPEGVLVPINVAEDVKTQ